MAAKREFTSPKEKWQSIRRRYAWHLSPPFKDTFEHPHWWKSESNVEPAAALYELARRHPLVGKVLLASIKRVASFWRDPHCPVDVAEGRLNAMVEQIVKEWNAPLSLYWTCHFGLKSWASLDYTDRKNWRHTIGNMKGLDFRAEFEKCRSITQAAHWMITANRRAALEEKGIISKNFDDDKSLRLLRKDIADNPITPIEWEKAVAHQAIAAYRRGHVLLSVAPGLTVKTAASSMVETYRAHIRSYPAPTTRQRARFEDWLQIISEFEEAEASGQKAKSQIFTRYRRALDSIRFS